MPRPSKDILNEIAAASIRHQVPADYFNRLIASESAYNSKALGQPIKFLGGVRAMGIGQFIPTSAAKYGIDPWNWKQSIDAAAHHLRDSYDKNPAAGWLTAIGDYKGKAGDDNVKAAYAKSVMYKDTIKVWDLPNVELFGADKQLISVDNYKVDDIWTSIGQAPIFKSLGWFQQDKIDPVTGESTKVDAQTGEVATGSFTDTLVNYGLVGLGAAFVVVSAVRLSL